MNEPTIYTRFNLPTSKAIDSTKRTRPTFELQDDKLVQTGEFNFYEQIQSYKGVYDVKNILNRYKAGDYSVLGNASGVYSDNTGVNTDLRNYTQKQVENKLISAFNNLPADIRSNFSSVDDFATAIKDGKLIDRLQRNTQTNATNTNNNSTGNGGVE